MVKIGVHRVIGSTGAFIEPALGHSMFTVVDLAFLVNVITLVLIFLGCEVGDAGIDVPYLSVLTNIIAVDGFPYAGRITLHRVGSNNLEEGGLQFRTFLAVGSLIVCVCGLCQ